MNKQLTSLLTLLALGAMLMGGCTTTKLSPDGPYKGDKVLYDADTAIVTATQALHQFVLWEFQNRDALAQWPEVTQVADLVRDNAKQLIQSAINMRDAYKANPTQDNLDKLELSLTLLRTALSETTKYLKP